MRPRRFLAACLLPLCLCAQKTGPKSLLLASRERIEAADYRVNGHFVRIDGKGGRLNVPFTLKAHWFPGVLRVWLDLSAPGKNTPAPVLNPPMAVHALFEMRPGGKNSIQIAHPGDKEPLMLGFDKWTEGPLGQGFSWEDFLEQQYFWEGQTALPVEKFGARECDVVETRPGPATLTHYAAAKIYLDQSNGFPVYIEKTLKGSGVVKQFTSFGIRHDEGVWSAHQTEARVKGQASSTLLIIDRGSARAHLTAADFNPQLLTRF